MELCLKASLLCVVLIGFIDSIESSVFLDTFSQNVKFGDVEGYIEPYQPLVGIGESVILRCNVTDESQVDNVSRFLTFKTEFSNEIINYTILDESTIQAVVTNVTETMDVGCFNETGSFGAQGLVSITEVTAIVPPSPVSKVECISNSLQDMTCHWCNASIDCSYYSYEFRYHRELEPQFNICPVYLDCCTCYFCGTNRNQEHICGTDPNNMTYVPGLEYNISIITVLEDYGPSLPYLEIVYANFKMVVLRQVEILEAVALNSSSMYVKWQQPDNFPYMDFTFFELYTQSEFDSTPVLKNSVMGIHELTLRDLNAFDNHTVAVRAKVNVSPYWSSMSFSYNRTLAAAPCEGPPLPLGAHRKTECSADGVPNCYNFQLFWQEYNQTCVNGLLQYYNITRTSNGITERESVPGTGFSHTLQLADNSAYTICVSAFTSDSFSSTNVLQSPESCLFIAEESTWPKKPEKVYAELSETEDILYFYFEHDLGPEENLTLLACLSDSIDCQSSPVALMISANATNYTMSPHPTGTGYGISANSENGQSSGFDSEWILPCKYYGEPGTPAEITTISDITYIDVEWKMLTCDGNTGHVLNYTLICSTIEEELVHNITVDGWTSRARCQELQADTEYKVSVHAYSRAGAGLPSDQMTARTLKQDQMEPWKVSGIVVAIFLACMASVAVVFGLREYNKAGKEHLDIFVPETGDHGNQTIDIHEDVEEDTAYQDDIGGDFITPDSRSQTPDTQDIKEHSVSSCSETESSSIEPYPRVTDNITTSGSMGFSNNTYETDSNDETQHVDPTVSIDANITYSETSDSYVHGSSSIRFDLKPPDCEDECKEENNEIDSCNVALATIEKTHDEDGERYDVCDVPVQIPFIVFVADESSENIPMTVTDIEATGNRKSNNSILPPSETSKDTGSSEHTTGNVIKSFYSSDQSSSDTDISNFCRTTFAGNRFDSVPSSEVLKHLDNTSTNSALTSQSHSGADLSAYCTTTVDDNCFGAIPKDSASAMDTDYYSSTCSELHHTKVSSNCHENVEIKGNNLIECDTTNVTDVEKAFDAEGVSQTVIVLSDATEINNPGNFGLVLQDSYT